MMLKTDPGHLSVLASLGSTGNYLNEIRNSGELGTTRSRCHGVTGPHLGMQRHAGKTGQLSFST